MTRKHPLFGIGTDIGRQQIAGDSIPGADLGDARQRCDDRTNDVDFFIGEAARLLRGPGGKVNFAVGEVQRRNDVVGNPFLAQIVQDRIVEPAIGIGKAAPKCLAGFDYMRHRAVAEHVAL
jgi:hypothetical protein